MVYLAMLMAIFAPHLRVLLFTEEFSLALGASVLFFITHCLLGVGQQKCRQCQPFRYPQLAILAVCVSAVLALLCFELLITAQDILEQRFHLHLTLAVIGWVSWVNWLGWDIFLFRYYLDHAQARVIRGMVGIVNLASLLVALCAIHSSSVFALEPYTKILMECALFVSSMLLFSSLLFSGMLLVSPTATDPPVAVRIPMRYGVWVGPALVLLLGLLLQYRCPLLLCWYGGTVWQPVSPGLAQRTVQCLTITGPVRVTAVRAALPSWQLRVVDAHQGRPGSGGSAQRLCPSVGAMINANFFDIENLNPLGLVIARGKTISPVKHENGWFGKWGIFYVCRGHAEIMPAEQPLPALVTEAVQAGPILIKQGKINANPLRQYAPRAALGLAANGQVIFAVAEGYLSFEQWAICLRDRLDCHDAINLDGGPSAQLAFHGVTSYCTPDTVSVPIFLQLVPGNK